MILLPLCWCVSLSLSRQQGYVKLSGDVRRLDAGAKREYGEVNWNLSPLPRRPYCSIGYDQPYSACQSFVATRIQHVECLEIALRVRRTKGKVEKGLLISAKISRWTVT